MKIVKNIRRKVTDRKRLPDCIERVCRPHMPHRPCQDCGGITDSWTIRINPSTLKRQKAWLCTLCTFAESRANQIQRDLAAKRTRNDWERVTDPVDHSAIEPDRMPEQYAGKTRSALRAFSHSSSTEAVVPGITAATLNQSILTMGLDSEMYAETRGEETVLRKVNEA